MQQETFARFPSSGSERFQSSRSPWPPLGKNPQNAENSAHDVDVWRDFVSTSRVRIPAGGRIARVGNANHGMP